MSGVGVGGDDEMKQFIRFRQSHAHFLSISGLYAMLS